MHFMNKLTNVETLQFMTFIVSEFPSKILFLPQHKLIKCIIYVGNKKEINNPYLIVNIYSNNKDVTRMEDMLNSELNRKNIFHFNIDDTYLFMKKQNKDDYEELVINNELRSNLIVRDRDDLYSEISNYMEYLHCYIKDMNVEKVDHFYS